MLVKSLGQPFDQLPVPIVFLPVLKADDCFHNLPLGAIARAAPLKMPRLGLAVVTAKVGAVGIEIRERLSALLAIRQFNGNGLRFQTLRPGKSQVKGALSPLSGTSEG